MPSNKTTYGPSPTMPGSVLKEDVIEEYRFVVNNMVAVPGQPFCSTQIPAWLWFFLKMNSRTNVTQCPNSNSP